MRKAETKAWLLAAAGALILVTGCATENLAESNTSIITAKKVEAGQGPSDISDTFTFEGNIYVFITFVWEPVTQHGGPQRIEARWFNGTKEVSRREHQGNFGPPPHYVWLWTRGTALGAGPCRVEIYANGKYVGQKAFRVVEK